MHYISKRTQQLYCMDKRDLEKIVLDADWKRLHDVIRDESETHIRSTISKLIDVFADLRMNKYTRIIPTSRLISHQKEVHLLLMFYEGEYIESICIESTHHLKRYIGSKVILISEDELAEAKQVLMHGDNVWRKGKFEFRYERKNIYSA